MKARTVKRIIFAIIFIIGIAILALHYSQIVPQNWEQCIRLYPDTTKSQIYETILEEWFEIGWLFGVTDVIAGGFGVFHPDYLTE